MRITVDMVQANKELNTLRKQMGLTLRDLMYDQARLLAQDAVKKVPPGPMGGPAEQKKAGASAIRNDLDKMFFVPDNRAALESWEDRLNDEVGDIVTTTKRGIRRIAKRKMISAGVSEISRLHKQHRNKRGRVRFSRNASEIAGGKYIVDEKHLNAYYKKAVKSVGRLKAGFIPAADRFARLVNTTAKSIPAWVRNQSVKQGTSINGIDPKTGRGFVEVINTVPYAERAISKSTLAFLESKRQTDINKHAAKRLGKVAREHNKRFARAA